MRVFLWVSIALITVPCAVSAGNKQVNFGPEPEWVKPSDPLPVSDNVQGAFFMRRQDIVVHLGSKGAYIHQGYRIKILQPSALNNGNISLSWSPTAGSVTVHKIKIFRGGDTIDVLKTASFEILRREGQLEAAQLDGTLTGILRIADLRVGDELEVAHTTGYNDPTLGNDDAGLLFLNSSPPKGRYRLELNWEQGRVPNIKITPDMATVAQNSAQAVSFRFDNPDIISPPKDAPQRFAWKRIIEYSSFDKWSAVSRRISPLYSKASSLPVGSSLKKEAKRISSSYTTALDRASAALKMVQQNIRYIYVGLDRGNLTPATAEETWERRYGDCKGKTVLLLALLSEMGIKAEPVLVNSAGNDDGMDLRLPSYRLFDHVIVRAELDGKNYWLDGTMPPFVTPSPETPYRLRWVLPLTAQGSSLEKIVWKWADSPNSIHLTDIDVRSGFDKLAAVVTTHIQRGIDGVRDYARVSDITPDQLLSSFQQNLVGSQWQTVDEVKWRYDEKARASVLSIYGTWKLDWEDDGDGARSYALPGGGFSPPNRRGRSANQDQQAPYYNHPDFNCHVTTVKLPTTSRPQQWASKPSFDTRMFGENYYRAFSLRNGAIRMIRGFRTESEEIDFEWANRDNDRIAAFDNSMGYIFYDPNGYRNPIDSKENVPAIDEIDWTSDNVPCLSQSSITQQK